MSWIVPKSPRRRRRLGWAAVLLVLAGGVAAILVLVPGRSPGRAVSSSQKVQVVRTPPTVPMAAARRRAIDALFDEFVPTAVERHDPLRARSLVTPSLLAGVSRAEWSRGDLPVFPYQARGTQFHGWKLDYSYPREISVDLMLQPAAKEPLGALMFTVIVKRVHQRWLVDSFVPVASFAPQNKKARIVAQPDLAPGLNPQGTKSRLSKIWLLPLAGIAALLIGVPISVGLAHAHQARRARRLYNSTR